MVLVILLVLLVAVVVALVAVTIEASWQKGYDDGIRGFVKWPHSKWYNRGLVYGDHVRTTFKEVVE